MIKQTSIKGAILLCLLFVSTFIIAQKVSDNPTLWDKISIQFEGPELNETSIPNPFTDYRLDVDFVSPNGDTISVPGYFAADGKAGESSAVAGKAWQVNFAANDTGTWNYKATFVTGSNVAAMLSGGESAAYFDGQEGSFKVLPMGSLKAKDFKSKGKLEYVEEHFLKFQESGEYFLKAGANSPEVFLEYKEFDNTPSDRTYPDFIADWKEGDPSWKEGLGKGIIGVVNYLSSIDVNSYYFLSMNSYGDGKQAWPWIDRDSLVRYDCSKLEQWDVVFQHMNAKGVMVHMVLTETENEALFELEELGVSDGFANSRKVYYREMIARYGYLPAVTWNIGEENGWAEGDGYHTANTNQQRKDFSDRLRALTYYNDHISIHNGPSTDDYIFEDLLGHENMTGPAFQWDFGKDIFDILYKWRQASAESGHKWVMSLDEPYVNPPTEDLGEWRTDNIWPTFMAGCAGIELYIGKGYDLTVQDFRTYEPYYNAMTVATNLFREYLPFYQLEPDLDFMTEGHTLRLADSIFVLYLPTANETIINLPAGDFKVEWYDPILGGAPTYGTTHMISGGNNVNVGTPIKNASQYWACIITKVDKTGAIIDLSTPSFPMNFNEGSSINSSEQKAYISSAGSEPLEGVTITSPSEDWLDATLINHTLILSLNENASTLPIGEYVASIEINAKNAEPAHLTYVLNVVYNLNGHDYYYMDNNMAVIEVESNPLLNHWVMETEEEGFFGSGYYFYEGPFVAEPVDTNVFEYYFYVPKAATYVVAIRNFIPNSDYTENNDSWLKMDDDRWWKHFSHTNQKWNWETQLDDGDENFSDPIWELEEGYHILKIGGRSDKFYLDKIHIYKEKSKEVFALDSSLIESGKSKHDAAIISLSRGYWSSEYEEGDIPDIKARSLKITNAGLGTFQTITAEANTDLINTEVSGEGNEQELSITFDEDIKSLSAGMYNFSVKLECVSATTREVKLYFNITSPVGIEESIQNNIHLKSTLIEDEISFITTSSNAGSVQIIDMNGKIILSENVNDFPNKTINIEYLKSGIYVVKINSDLGVHSQKIIKN